MWKFFQSDKNGTSAEFEDGNQLVTQVTCPPLLPQKCKVWGQKFTITGIPTGSDDLGVDGSGTPVDYYIPADTDNDIYITKISFVIGYGSAAELWEFADKNAALTNGINIHYTDTHGNDIVIGNPKTNYDFLRLSLSDGIIPTAWELRHLGATNDYGILLAVDLTKYVPSYGIKLDRCTNQRITITIRDDCTDADTFNCRAFGFERFE